MKIFIVATNTDVGKTYTAIKLIKQLISDGYKVSAFKPIETGVVDTPKDASNLLKAINIPNITLDDITAYTFTLPAAPYIVSNTKIQIQKIQNKLKKLEEISDIVIIEGAGGLLTPIDKDFFMIDLIDTLNIDHTLLVANTNLGCINDTLLSMQLLKQNKIKFTYCFNQKDKNDNFEKISKPFFDDNFDTVLMLDDDIQKLTQKIIKGKF